MTIVSIGYEGRTQEELVELLVSHGVTVLFDVRLNPISRKPGLSKRRLAEALSTVGIDYVHLRALGNPRSNRAPFHDGRLAEGREVFRQLLTTAESDAAVQQILDASRSTTAAVLCFERDQERCHRWVVVDEVLRREPGMDVRNVQDG